MREGFEEEKNKIQEENSPKKEENTLQRATKPQKSLVSYQELLERDYASPFNPRRLLMEALCTFLFWTGVTMSHGDIFFFYCTLWGVVVFVGDFSGAHMNQVISFLIFAMPESKFSFKAFLVYILVQFVSGTIALLVCIGYEYNIPESGTVPENNAEMFRWLFAEAYGEFIFLLGFLIQASEKTRVTSDRIWGPFIVVMAYFIGRGVAHKSGAYLNCSYAIVEKLLFWAFTQDTSFLRVIWIYVLGDWIGGVTALIIYSLVFRKLFVFGQRKGQETLKNTQTEKEKTTQEPINILTPEVNSYFLTGNPDKKEHRNFAETPTRITMTPNESPMTTRESQPQISTIRLVSPFQSVFSELSSSTRVQS